MKVKVVQTSSLCHFWERFFFIAKFLSLCFDTLTQTKIPNDIRAYQFAGGNVSGAFTPFGDYDTSERG